MRRVQLPPGPRGLPWLGNALQYARDPLGFLTRCARKYGDVVRLAAPGQTFYQLNHPRDIETVLRGQHQNFHKWQPLRATARLFGSGLLTNEGDSWKQQRKLCNPSLQSRQVQTYSPAMVEHTCRLLEGWKPGQVRVINDDFNRLALAILTRTLFGIDLDTEAVDLEEVLGSVLGYFGDPFNSLVLPSWLPTPANLRYRRGVRTLDALIARLTAQRRTQLAQGRPGTELLSRLLAARDESGGGMSERQLRDELITIAFAGHKTTAATLTYTFLLLAQHPEADARLAEEGRQVLGQRLPTAEDVPNLPYTECVIKEALRLYPPSWGIGREALADCEIAGYLVRRGTQVVTVQWVVHRDGRWFDSPEKFLPERWADGLEERLPRCAYFPFGDGPRVCIGGHFAMLETVLILATIVRRFRLTLVPDQKFRLVPSVTLWPKPGIKMVVGTRS
jgi:cytochrome P450